MAKSNLLKEAIADAKAVRETAIANAKIALEEAFTPRLQSMLSNKIEEEMEEDEDDTVEEQTDSSNIGTGDNKVDVADGDDEEKSETDTTSAAYGSEDSNNTVVDKLTEADDDEDPEEMKEMKEEEDEDPSEMAYKEDEDMEEEDLDLEAIIRELEADDEMEEGEDEDHTEMHDMEEAEDEEHSEMKDMEETEDMDETEETGEEEVDLDEIIKSLKEEDEDEDEDEVNESEDGMEGESTRVSDLTEKLKEAYGTIQSLKGTINEVNLLNAKLLFSNKLFKSHNLTEGQKMKIIETFDRAQSTREVKLVYSTLAESLSAGASKKSTIKEGFASKATRSTKPAPKAVIVEADQFTNRMKKLAGLQ
jgi:hypothetical protein